MLSKIHPFALIVLILIVILLMFVACSDSNEQYAQQPIVMQQPQPVMQQPQPVIVQQPVVQQSHDGFLTGLLAGHLMSGGSRDVNHYHYSQPSRRNVTFNTVNVNKSYYTTKKSSFFGGKSRSSSGSRRSYSR